MKPPPTAACTTRATLADTPAESPTPTTTTFRVAEPPPTSTKRVPAFEAATACAACTSTSPTANTRPQRCCTRLFTNGVTDPTDSAEPTAARYVTFARVTDDAACIPDHTARADTSANPSGPVTKHAENATY